MYRAITFFNAGQEADAAQNVLESVSQLSRALAANAWYSLQVLEAQVYSLFKWLENAHL